MTEVKSMSKKRYNYSPEEKVLILKRHLVGWAAFLSWPVMASRPTPPFQPTPLPRSWCRNRANRPLYLPCRIFLDHWAGKLIFLTSRASFIGEMAKFCHCPSHGQ